MKVAFLGLGEMGRRMCARLIAAGHEVTAWNRTRSAPIEATVQGAAWAASPREAATGADIVIAMLTDDAVSADVWTREGDGALHGMAPDALAIDSSTLSPDGVRALGEAMRAKHVRFVEAPVSGSLPQAESGQLVYLVGGDKEVCDLAAPLLCQMGSVVKHVGPLGCGALTKLSTNALLGIQVTALAELSAMLSKAGVDAAPIFDAMASTPVWSTVAGRIVGSIRAGDFTPQFPIRLIDKDFNYLVAACGTPTSAPTLAATRDVFDRAMEEGLGDLNMTGVARLYP
ncbi:MAG: 2-hydroxy-3-oxopropionate reductase [Luteibacter sp.]|uniref:NAD(P)-dependent oxidoreductase n=1 Tax=Luteibacter sp. TaxID=1886636 RepID=UPI0013850C5A|nr:NAD(P)-dependent oxidoreductase [Luteibacter sp.]KAF1003591.1 MAG: 2-hydroxy-3-oxopropionate reductase [Luteibacter sp.]